MNITEYDLSKTTGEAVIPFYSSLEYIEEELKRLDLKLILYIQSCLDAGTINSDMPEFTSEDEIFTLLEGFSTLGSDREQIENQISLLDILIAERLEAGREQGRHISLQYLSWIYGLGAFEQFCIIACLAPEVDQKYQKVYGFLQNDMTEKKPTIDMLSKIFQLEKQERSLLRSVFDIQAPLAGYLMELHNELSDSWIPLITRHLKLDDWIVNYLLDINIPDTQLIQVAEFIMPAGKWKDNTPPVTKNGFPWDLGDKIIRFVEYYRDTGREGLNKVFYFYGPHGVGKTEQVISICDRLGLPLIMVDAERMLLADGLEELFRRLERQARVSNAAVCLKNIDLLLKEANLQSKQNRLLKMLQTIIPLTFILGHTQWNPTDTNNTFTFVSVEFPYPNGTERRYCWEQQSRKYKLDDSVELDKFSENFRFTQGQIKTVLKLGESSSVWNQAENGSIGREELYNSCYAQSNKKLSTLAARIKALYTMEMLVLPKEQMDQMQEICNQVEYRSLVYEKWGFEKRLSLGKGLNVLFSGPPGSGKTMAAEVIANEIGLEIYKIDVSQVVSKYIGETEKNLEEIFKEAETSNAILFFDEADALFGKRSEVKDAHDRYANVEIGYLLQRMEEYDGIVILATNLNQNIDEAFLRRLHFNVNFPFPDREQRKLIWQGIFPAAAPVDRELDYDFLAEKFVLAGGNIKNIALNAAFYAAHASGSIGIKDIMLAAKREYKKLGKTFLMSDYAPYYQLIEVKK